MCTIPSGEHEHSQCMGELTPSSSTSPKVPRSQRAGVDLSNSLCELRGLSPSSAGKAVCTPPGSASPSHLNELSASLRALRGLDHLHSADALCQSPKHPSEASTSRRLTPTPGPQCSLTLTPRPRLPPTAPAVPAGPVVPLMSPQCEATRRRSSASGGPTDSRLSPQQKSRHGSPCTSPPCSPTHVHGVPRARAKSQAEAGRLVLGHPGASYHQGAPAASSGQTGTMLHRRRFSAAESGVPQGNVCFLCGKKFHWFAFAKPHTCGICLQYVCSRCCHRNKEYPQGQLCSLCFQSYQRSQA